MTRTRVALALIACLWPASAFAQAPASAPLVLAVPSSARVTALGGAWVAGRDQDVVFSNPAQLIGARSDFSLSLAHWGPGANGGSFASVYAGGKWSLTLGFGVKLLNFTTEPGRQAPFPPDTLLTRGTADAQSSLVTVGAAVVYKKFRIGGAGKYVGDRTGVNPHAMLVDLGVARTLVGGVAAAAVQNLGRRTLSNAPDATIPRQLVMGWSTAKPAGPLDLGLFTQVTTRHGWTSPAAGLEAGYSWIEGYSVTLRAGVRRPESTTERPMTLGVALSGDRLTFDYALRFFEGNRHAHVVTFRWR